MTTHKVFCFLGLKETWCVTIATHTRAHTHTAESSGLSVLTLTCLELDADLRNAINIINLLCMCFKNKSTFVSFFPLKNHPSLTLTYKKNKDFYDSLFHRFTSVGGFTFLIFLRNVSVEY